ESEHPSFAARRVRPHTWRCSLRRIEVADKPAARVNCAYCPEAKEVLVPTPATRRRTSQRAFEIQRPPGCCLDKKARARSSKRLHRQSSQSAWLASCNRYKRHKRRWHRRTGLLSG